MGCSGWAVLAATVALAAAREVGLEARIAKVASRALVRTAGEALWGQTQRRWGDPPAERAMDGGVLPQNQHKARWTRGLGRGKRHILQRDISLIPNFAGTLPSHAKARVWYKFEAGRWMTVQGRLKMQAHPACGVVMNIASCKVSHSGNPDIDASALRAARARSSSIGAMERFICGFDWHKNSLRPAKTKELGVSNSVVRWNVSSVGSTGTRTHSGKKLQTNELGVSNSVGRWRKGLDKGSRRAHLLQC